MDAPLASPTTATTETELKLCCPPDYLAALLAHPLFSPEPDAPVATRRLVTRYFDTPAGALGRAGYALRVREEEGQRWQAIKTQGHAVAGVHVRGEWEGPVSGETPDLACLPPGAPTAAVTALIADAPLLPLVVTDFQRTLKTVRSGTTLVELALDVGEIRAGGRCEPLLEVELEVKAGPPSGLFPLALALCEVAPLTVSPHTKADRGAALLTGQPPRRVPAPPPPPVGPLGAGLGAAEAARRIGANALGQLLAQAPRLLSDDEVEAVAGVHQTRVALRRLRSVLTLFGPARPAPAALVADLRWVMGVLGPARDLDVFLTEILPPLAARLEGDPGLASLLEQGRREQHALRAAAQAAVCGPRFTTLILRLSHWLDAPGPLPSAPALGALAEAALERRWRRMRRAGRGFDTLPDPARHALRVRIKKIRYALEVLAPLYAERPVRDTLRALKDAQEALGQANDAAVARHRLGHLALLSGDPVLAFGAGRIAGLLEGQRDSVDLRARETWATVRRLTPPWDD
ncbi:CYTH and CHAD domain-containing protein [Pararhodospirillum photometricum]|nr:CYTH and CHAD domain-containing protein [Pararhodospirillum photometricum]